MKTPVDPVNVLRTAGQAERWVWINMKNLTSILEAIPDDEFAYVILSSGNELELSNFESVDQTIYDSTDFMIADVGKKVVGDKRFHTPDTKIEFNIKDVVQVKRINTGDILYQSQNK